MTKNTDRNIPFTVVRECTDTYHLENGQTVKVSTILVNVTNKPGDKAALVGSLDIRQTTHVITPPNLTLDDLKYAPDHATELKFMPEETINIYETGDFFILLHTKVKKIALTGKLNDKNEPIVRVSGRAQMATPTKPTN